MINGRKRTARALSVTVAGVATAVPFAQAAATSALPAAVGSDVVSEEELPETDPMLKTEQAPALAALGAFAVGLAANWFYDNFIAEDDAGGDVVYVVYQTYQTYAQSYPC